MQISFHTLGDEAMLINFEQKIEEHINDKVHVLNNEIELAQHPAIRYTVPGYCSITIAFNKDQISYKALTQFVLKFTKTNMKDKVATRTLYIPVCYDRTFALDLNEVCQQTNLSASEVIHLHTSTALRTYMIGFLPGFPYLGKLPEEMFCARKDNPRLKVPQGAVAIAGLQAGIYPKVSPGGWQIIGKTPINLISNKFSQPFLIQPGDIVRFYSISKNMFNSILKEQEQGLFCWENIYG